MYEILARETPYYKLSNSEVIEFVCEQDQRLPKPALFEYPEELFEIMQQVNFSPLLLTKILCSVGTRIHQTDHHMSHSSKNFPAFFQHWVPSIHLK